MVYERKGGEDARKEQYFVKYKLFWVSFERYPVRTSAWAAVIMFEGLHGFSQPL
jgi:hypothetical protein